MLLRPLPSETLIPVFFPEGDISLVKAVNSRV